jgi:hypothetical protein
MEYVLKNAWIWYYECLDKAGHNLQIENKLLFDLHFHDWLNNCD